MGTDGVTPVGNARSGIEVAASNATLSNNVVGGTHPDQPGQYAAELDEGTTRNMYGHGIWVTPSCRNVIVHHNTIGLSPRLNQAVSNFGWGIWVQQGTACSSAKATLPDDALLSNYLTFNNTIGGNRRSAIYPEGGRSATLSQFHQQNTIAASHLANGWGTQACGSDGTSNGLCACRISQGKLVVNCALLGNLGPDFPSELPPQTHSLSLRDTALISIHWEAVNALEHLEKLDLSENPQLDATPPGGVYSFKSSSLKQVSLTGTDLSEASSAMLQSLGPQLELFDIASASRTPSNNVEFNATGMQKLGSFLWFNSTRCPSGWLAPVAAGTCLLGNARKSRNHPQGQTSQMGTVHC